MRYIYTTIHNSPSFKFFNYIYITDGQTRKIYTLSVHFYHITLFYTGKYQKSHENVEITLYYTGYVTINTV